MRAPLCERLLSCVTQCSLSACFCVTFVPPRGYQRRWKGDNVDILFCVFSVEVKWPKFTQAQAGKHQREKKSCDLLSGTSRTHNLGTEVYYERTPHAGQRRANALALHTAPLISNKADSCFWPFAGRIINRCSTGNHSWKWNKSPGRKGKTNNTDSKGVKRQRVTWFGDFLATWSRYPPKVLLTMTEGRFWKCSNAYHLKQNSNTKLQKLLLLSNHGVSPHWRSWRLKWITDLQRNRIPPLPFSPPALCHYLCLLYCTWALFTPSPFLSALFLHVQTKPALFARTLRCEDRLLGQRLMECL